MGPWEVGQIKAHMVHDWGATEIARHVLKPDGKSTFSRGAIQTAMAKLERDKKWRGQRKKGSGAPRKTTKQVDKLVVKTVLKNRGRRKMNVKQIKRMVPEVQHLSKQAVSERLHGVGLIKTRRREKTLVPGQEHKDARLDWSARIKRKALSTLKRWCYSDGMSYYCDRSTEEVHNSQRASLGKFVWRMEDGSDALFDDCVGPSSYKKAQGIPVKVWGLLAGGQLHCHILPKGQNMTGVYYAWLIRGKFGDWRGKHDLLVQDWEKCLRADVALDAMREVGLKLVSEPEHPTYCQDFNAIENAWGLLRGRTDATCPMDDVKETRDVFIVRLRNAIQWVNKNHRKYLQYLMTNQKERAQECEDLKGARTSW
jgi:hypothetical protein